MDERPVVFEFRDREQVGSGVVAQQPRRGALVGHGPGRPRSTSSWTSSAEIKDKGKVERGWLGVGIGRGSGRPDRDRHGRRESPAELAKLKDGDVVLKMATARIPGPRRPGRRRSASGSRDRTSRSRSSATASPWTSRSSSASWPRTTRARRWTSASPASSAERRRSRPCAGKPEAGAQADRPFDVRGRPVRDPQVHRRLLQRAEPRAGRALRRQGRDGLLVTAADRGRPGGEGRSRSATSSSRPTARRVETVNELLDLVQDKKKGDKIKLEVLRDKKTLTLDVEVQEDKSGDLLRIRRPPELPRIVAGIHGRLQRASSRNGRPRACRSSGRASKKLSLRGGQRRI